MRLFQRSEEHDIENVMIGMAHSGRLNVLAHVLGKPYEALLSEFQGTKCKIMTQIILTNAGQTLDVKYHLGATRNLKSLVKM